MSGMGRDGIWKDCQLTSFSSQFPPANPTSLHSRTPTTPLVSHSRHTHFHSQYSESHLLGNTHRITQQSLLAFPFPLSSILPSLQEACIGPCCPGNPRPELTACPPGEVLNSGVTWRRAARHLECGGLRRGMWGAQVLAPIQKSKAAREQEKNRPNCVWGRVG